MDKQYTEKDLLDAFCAGAVFAVKSVHAGKGQDARIGFREWREKYLGGNSAAGKQR